MKCLTCLCLVGLLFACAASAAPLYHISGPIGLSDFQHFNPYPTDLNDAGQVIGSAGNYVSNGSEGSQGQSAWFYNGATTTRIGLFGPEYTLDYQLYFTHYYGRQNSYITKLNQAGQVLGSSYRWHGAQNPTGNSGPGYSTWLFNGTSTVQIGIVEPENTDGYGYQYSSGSALNEAGQAIGYAYRFQGTGNFNARGYTAWFYNGATTTNIGLTGPDYTDNIGSKRSSPLDLNDAGQVSGYSIRYAGGGGQTAWLYDGAATIDIGLTGPEHTRNDGYSYSSPSSDGLNEAGQVIGYSTRYNGGSTSLGNTAWIYDGATTIPLGLIGSEHTRNDGFRSSSPSYDGLNEAGQVIGSSTRFNGGTTVLGFSTWLYDGTTTVPIGLTGPDYTRNDGYKRSSFAFVDRPLNNAGQALGYSNRYNGGNLQLGQSVWLYNGATTFDIGLTAPEHTRNDGYKYSDVEDLNEVGQAIGYSERYNGGSTKLGQSAWFYNGATTIDIGLNDPEHTSFDGYQWSAALQLNDAGQVLGSSYRYVGGSNQLGQDAWLYDPTLNQTIPLQLSTLSNGYAASGASYLGEDGLVLGSYQLFDALGNNLGSRGFYFTIADGLHDLGSLVDGSLAAGGWDYLTYAYRANHHGQFIGYGKLTSQNNGQTIGFLLSPIAVPEPSTFILAAAAFGFCLGADDGSGATGGLSARVCATLLDKPAVAHRTQRAVISLTY